MKKLIIIPIIHILFIPLYAQSIVGCFESYSKDRIRLLPNGKINLEFRYSHLLTPTLAMGIYTVSGETIKVSIQPYPYKEISRFELIDAEKSNENETSIIVNCIKIDNNDCFAINWQIRNISQIIDSGVFEENQCSLKINNIKSLENDSLFLKIGNLNYQNLLIPIKRGYCNVFSVKLARSVNYVDFGNFELLIKKDRKGKYLQLINGNKLIGVDKMNFWNIDITQH